MSTAYKYEAYTFNGEPNNGEIVADSVEDARTQLAQQKLIVVSVKQPKQKSVLARDLVLRPNHVKLNDVAWMARNLATSQAAGLSIFRSMGMLAKQKANKPIGKILNETHQEIADGKSLSAAFKAHEDQLGPLTTALIDAGEASGRLDESLSKLADITEARVRLRRKITSALMYPVLVLFLSLSLTLVMLLTIVPTFAGVYKSLNNAKLPLPTRIMLGISDFLLSYWFIWVPGIVAVVVAIIVYRNSASGRRTLDRVTLRLPIFGKLLQQAIVARISAVMSSLLAAGVSLLDVLDLSASVAGNAVYRDALLRARDKVREGRPLSRALADQQVFPDVFVQLCAVGEETGAVSDLLSRYSKATEDEVQTMVDGLTSLLEPVLIVVLGGIVGVLVISLYLPLFNVVKQIK